MGIEGNPKKEDHALHSNEVKKHAFRENSDWKDLYWSHVVHLKKTYREVTPDGDPVTEELLDSEATEMADTQYRMKMKQKALETKRRLERDGEHGELAELRKQAEEGNEWAMKILHEKQKRKSQRL